MFATEMFPVHPTAFFQMVGGREKTRERERERERGKREDEDESDGRRYVPEVAVECGEVARSRELNAGDRRRGQERQSRSAKDDALVGQITLKAKGNERGYERADCVALELRREKR